MSRPALGRAVRDRLERWVGAATAESVLQNACRHANLNPSRLAAEHLKPLCRHLETSLLPFLEVTEAATACGEVKRLAETLSTNPPPNSGGSFPLMTELDLARARKAALDLSLQMGFSDANAVRIATVASELARNVLRHAGSGTMTVSSAVGPRRSLIVVAEDRGPGIPNLDGILANDPRPNQRTGLGLPGSRRLVDELKIETGSGGTRVTARKFLVRE
jgi:serine/threonine-protein kinase RsbT